MLKKTKSKELYEIAQQYIPGGVNSPVRAFKAVGTDPLFINRAKGAKVYDIDGNEYIDYVCSWGPLILGHSDDDVVKAICDTAVNGTSYGAPCEAELELAKLICDAFPSMDKVRMVNSGTEATMSAVRVARAYTGRNKIVKFEGCFHGHADTFLIKAGSGLLTAGKPTSPGVPDVFAEHTLNAKYNDLESVKDIFKQWGNEIAAVIVEPVAGNMGLVLPDAEFLKGLRNITELNGSMLIFDEVITGFRTCYGGFQNIVEIEPDLTTLGKIIGGGLPVGAYGGRKELMDMVAPVGDVYQAGTLSGNPLAMVAGATTLKKLKNNDYYDRIEVLGYLLTGKLKTIFEEHDLYCTINRLGSMFSVFFTEQEVNNYEAVQTCDTDKYAKFHRELINKGIYFPPAQFEVCFISCAHEVEDIEKTAEAINDVLNTIK
ncbi:Glutamate-1-semialdehyde 2,1-aminomutase [Candidatus Syntrophocurvum alkaliphilum]|uniref:Glutamate-1-semialdehyde 2,1-aminomutase n=1 Tax=Candidatus Syntrophocurvum alkaliphilum TaxID=2293317 RepID=A0A6I6DEW9_9FIRM|nr:glutamate-1-semialdehyde 2,1-aminomutase [Candidatus Syntrophocurvum alkaliphilum]QGT99058.1 Glutamate-1-semialdehyde 2,1-aminomutase [Candidatus Syntrophocurvum alkaliphilum]